MAITTEQYHEIIKLARRLIEMGPEATACFVQVIPKLYAKRLDRSVNQLIDRMKNELRQKQFKGGTR